MEVVVLIGVLLYASVGFFIGMNKINSGFVGAVGPLGTLIAWMILWPLMLLAK